MTIFLLTIRMDRDSRNGVYGKGQIGHFGLMNTKTLGQVLGLQPAFSELLEKPRQFGLENGELLEAVS